jgi:hypothetical protein
MPPARGSSELVKSHGDFSPGPLRWKRSWPRPSRGCGITRKRSVALVRAGFRLQIDHAPGDISILRRMRSGLHRELLNSIERNIEAVVSPLSG